MSEYVVDHMEKHKAREMGIARNWPALFTRIGKEGFDFEQI